MEDSGSKPIGFPAEIDSIDGKYLQTNYHIDIFNPSGDAVVFERDGRGVGVILIGSNTNIIGEMMRVYWLPFPENFKKTRV